VVRPKAEKPATATTVNGLPGIVLANNPQLNVPQGTPQIETDAASIEAEGAP
jgi:hypothetical protein